MAKAVKRQAVVPKDGVSAPINLKQVAIEEFAKCKASPEYFILKYVWIQMNELGRGKFEMFPFQKKLLHLIHTRDRIVILKSRQLGITTLCSAYALWLFMFKPDSSTLCLAHTTNIAKAMIDKFKFAYKEIPNWMIDMANANTTEANQKKVVAANGAKIEALSGSRDAPRSKTATFLVFDELAFVEEDEETYASAQQTLATGGKCVALSTPNGADGKFYELFTKAELDENQYVPVRLPWQVHPQHDQSWRDAQDEELGKRLAMQECDTEFLTSGNTYFEPEDLDFYKEQLEEPILKREKDESFWVWKFPEDVGNCAVIVDTSRGDGNDFSTVQVIDLVTGNQIAEYKGDKNPKDLATFAVMVSIEYNYALLIVENTGIGNTTCSYVTDSGYKNIYKSLKGDTGSVSQYLYKYQDEDKMTPGFTTSTTTRPNLLNALRQMVMERSMRIPSKRAYLEMRTFIWKGSKPTAKNGCNDDLLIPLAIGAYLRDTALTYASQGLDMQRACLNNIQSTNMKLSYSNRKPTTQPYMMQNPVTGEMEDYSWVM